MARFGGAIRDAADRIEPRTSETLIQINAAEAGSCVTRVTAPAAIGCRQAPRSPGGGALAAAHDGRLARSGAPSMHRRRRGLIRSTRPVRSVESFWSVSDDAASKAAVGRGRASRRVVV